MLDKNCAIPIKYQNKMPVIELKAAYGYVMSPHLMFDPTFAAPWKTLGSQTGGIIDDATPKTLRRNV